MTGTDGRCASAGMIAADRHPTPRRPDRPGAPLAGGPSTPELAAAVSNAGGPRLPRRGLPQRGRARGAHRGDPRADGPPVRREPVRPGPDADPATYADYVADLGEPRWDDDAGTRSSRCSSATRSPSSRTRSAARTPLPDLPGEAWVTVTSPDEAAAAAHADALVVQGAEAGGHRGSWVDTPDLDPIGLFALLQLIETAQPIVAAGGIAHAGGRPRRARTRRRAAQVGTAFLLAPEAGTVPAHRERLAARRRADRPHPRVQRPARARHPQPLHGRAPRRADRVPGDPLRDGDAARRGAHGGRRGRLQPVGRRGAPARARGPPPRSAVGWQERDEPAEARAQVVVQPLSGRNAHHVTAPCQCAASSDVRCPRRSARRAPRRARSSHAAPRARSTGSRRSSRRIIRFSAYCSISSY